MLAIGAGLVAGSLKNWSKDGGFSSLLSTIDCPQNVLRIVFQI